jgi:hypothetical protein
MLCIFVPGRYAFTTANLPEHTTNLLHLDNQHRTDYLAQNNMLSNEADTDPDNTFFFIPCFKPAI